MSDTMNSIISRPLGIDPAAALKSYADLAQAQALAARQQVQVQGDQITNAGASLDLLGRQLSINQYLAATGQPQLAAGPLSAPGGAAPQQAPLLAKGSPAPQQGGYLNGLASAPPQPSPAAMLAASQSAPSSPAASAMSAPNSLLALSGNAPAAAGWGQPLAPGQQPSAATHSPGMPADGALLGSPVTPSGVQTLFGVPIPNRWALTVSMMPLKDQPAALKDMMENRRQRLQEIFSSGDWNTNLSQAYQQGFMDCQHYTALAGHPEMQPGILAGLASPDAYQKNLVAYSGQSIQMDPVTGQHVVSPVSLQAKQAGAASTALGTSQGELVNARELAADRALGGARAGFTLVTRPVIGPDGKQAKNPDGSRMTTQSYVNNEAFANQTRGAAPAAAGGAGQGAAPAAGSATNPLLGDMPNWVALPDGSMGPPQPAPGSPPAAVADNAPPQTGGTGPGVQHGPAPVGAVQSVGQGGAPPARFAPPTPTGGVPPQAPPRPSGAPADLSSGTPLAAPPTAAAPSAALASFPVVGLPSGGSAALATGQPAVGGVGTGMQVLSPTQKANLEVQTSARQAQNTSDIGAMATLRSEGAKASQSAVTQNAVLDQMRVEAQQFNQGSLANWTQGMKKAWGSVAQTFGEGMPLSVSSWEDFSKNAGSIVRAAASQISPRVGVQELQLVQKFLPSATMTPQGFSRMADQMEGLNDYAVARNTLAANFQGSPAQFEAQMASTLSPGAFIVARMPAADLQTFVAGMNKTPEGRATLARISSGLAFAKQAGLLPTAGAQ